MERATQIDERGYYLTGDGIYSDWGVPEKFRGDDIDRLAAYEDTGLEPEEVRSQKELFDYLVFDSTPSEDIERFKRLRELAQADREGRCVVLDGKSRDKELICKLVRLFYWLEDCIKKKDFSPFRRVAGAPENNYPFISAFQRIENEYELEIHLAGKDEEAEAALATDC